MSTIPTAIASAAPQIVGWEIKSSSLQPPCQANRIVASPRRERFQMEPKIDQAYQLARPGRVVRAARGTPQRVIRGTPIRVVVAAHNCATPAGRASSSTHRPPRRRRPDPQRILGITHAHSLRAGTAPGVAVTFPFLPVNSAAPGPRGDRGSQCRA